MSQIEKHYAEVANQILQSLDADAIVGREQCCEPLMHASEANALYMQQAIESLPAAAKAASRGCGDPVGKAQLQPGEVVLDLGSGGGIDALIASKLVGSKGRVYGVDMTPQMVQLARQNAADAQCANVEFLQGNIETTPLPSSSVDVVISNCVINLADDKAKVLQEACRVLKPGGRLVVSDIVRFAFVEPQYMEPLGRITGCLNGMLSAQEYSELLAQAGFARCELEPKTIYTLDVLLEKAQRKDRLEFYQQIEGVESVSGASGSAIVTAWKQ